MSDASAPMAVTQGPIERPPIMKLSELSLARLA